MTNKIDKYQQEINQWNEQMEKEKPLKEQYGYANKMWPNRDSEAAYDKAYSEWDMKRFCDAPNKPGYFRANND